MTSERRFPWFAAATVAVAAVAAVVLLLAPVTATYINDVGSDTIEYRTASCGAPLATLLGAEPVLGGGSVHRLGPHGARAACDAVAGKRVSGALLLLLLLSTIGWLAAVKARKRTRSERESGQPLASASRRAK